MLQEGTMPSRSSSRVRAVALIPAALALALSLTTAGQSQTPEAPAPPPAPAHPIVQRLALEEARERVVANSRLLALAALNVEGKGFATRALRAQYFPQIVGNTVYFHFNNELGTVVTTPGRTVTGPRGAPLATFPSVTIDAAVFNQDSQLTTLAAVQPLTALLKVRAGVKAARADEEIAQAQLEKGRRELVSGTEQLFWGLLATQRIRAGALEGVRAAEKLAGSPSAPVELRLALAEARQALGQVESQLADLQEQMNLLLDLPVCTQLELVEPPLPVACVKCADEAVSLALANSPEVREAEQTVLKAQAGVAANKVDYLPNVVIMGGYANQSFADYIQPNIGYVGVMGSYTFVDWGKRRNTIRQSENLVALASLKVRTTQDEVRQKALKAFRQFEQGREGIQAAEEMLKLRKEAEQKATTPEALTNPGPLLAATKKRAEAEVDLVKADLAYRTAYVELMALIGHH
jgi:outer membrane protein TolC